MSIFSLFGSKKVNQEATAQTTETLVYTADNGEEIDLLKIRHFGKTANEESIKQLIDLAKQPFGNKRLDNEKVKKEVAKAIVKAKAAQRLLKEIDPDKNSWTREDNELLSQLITTISFIKSDAKLESLSVFLKYLQRHESNYSGAWKRNLIAPTLYALIDVGDPSILPSIDSVNEEHYSDIKRAKAEAHKKLDKKVPGYQAKVFRDLVADIVTKQAWDGESDISNTITRLSRMMTSHLSEIDKSDLEALASMPVKRKIKIRGSMHRDMLDDSLDYRWTEKTRDFSDIAAKAKQALGKFS